MRVVIPLAGSDEQFQAKGYPYCKALCEIDGLPMIEHAWNCLNKLDSEQNVFVIRKQDAVRYHLQEVLRLMDPRAVVVQADGITAGAACTALLAIEHIDDDEELVIANGDQVFHVDLGAAVQSFRDRQLDGGTIVFDSVHPRWSFVKIDDDGLVVEAAEKMPISRLATAGFYYFRSGKRFIEAAASMIKKAASVNGAFYVCPAFNEMILRHARIGVHMIQREDYVSLATPNAVEEYEELLAAKRRAAH
jgi:dTDP-glucose pyrophosphorylase